MKSMSRNCVLGVAGCLALAAVCTIVTVPENAQAKGKPIKDDGGGGGTGGPISLKVIIENGNPISADNDLINLNVYTDGVDSVQAISDAGFRFDTDGTDKITNNKKQVRYVNFDFSGTGLGPEFPPGVEPGVDVRMGDETDEDGGHLAMGRLDLSTMAPNVTRYGRFIFNFGFENSAGKVEKWQLAYGQAPGTDGDGNDYGPVVTVMSGADGPDADEFADSWTIIGTDAGLRLMSIGKGLDLREYHGKVHMPFELSIERLP